MGRLHRKLSQEDCKADCFEYPPSDHDCEDACIRKGSSPGNHSKLPTYLIIICSVVAAAFFVFCCYAIYVKFFSSRNRSRRRLLSLSSRQQQQEAQEDTTRDEFLDEEHGPMVDHPIWYIRTPGLHQSIINAITVCKYKRGEGLVEGTDCSVCLSEFQEDESLRLLPKCNHAFHLPCIDTWLRSHTNCPMCRAPIVTNPAATRIPSMEPNVVDSSSLEGATQMGSLANSVGAGGDGAGGAGAELRNGSVEEEQVEVEGGGTRVCENEGSAAEVANMQPRRSVSLDSSSAAKISAAIATVVSSVQESHGNSKRQIGEATNELVASKRFVAARGSSSSSRTRNLQNAPGSMKRSRSFNGKHLMSWYSRSSEKKPSAPVRSF